MKKAIGAAALFLLAALGLAMAPAYAATDPVPGWTTSGVVEVKHGHLTMTGPATIGRSVDLPLASVTVDMSVSSEECTDEALVVVLTTDAGQFTGWPKACGKVDQAGMTWFEFPEGKEPVTRTWAELGEAFPEARTTAVELGVTRGQAKFTKLWLTARVPMTKPNPDPKPTKTPGETKSPSPTPTQTTEPTPTTSPSVTASPSETPSTPGATPTHTDAPTDPETPSTTPVGASEELPVTGGRVPVGIIAGLGVILLGSGVGIMAGVRMRRDASTS